jgi:acetate kinase
VTRVLVVNAGSSSLKLSVLEADDAVARSTELERWDGDASDARVSEFVSSAGTVDAIGHRVVHGGVEFEGPVVVDEGVERSLAQLVDLAPLHQPRAIAGIEAMKLALPGVRGVACFDTAFHASMPAAASTYALPREWRERWPVRRFGFHGLSHAYAYRRACELAGGSLRRVVTCHLGAGASLCAVLEGESVDTTMGFTPLEGLVMVTRSGTIDPGLVTWLARDGGLSVDEIDDALTHRSGLAGLAGGSGDMRDVLAALARGEADAQLAFDVFVHRLRREIGAMTAALAGLDALVFTGGIGEHAPDVRQVVSQGLGYLGISIDDVENRDGQGDRRLHVDGAHALTYVVTAREDVEIARQVRSLVGEGVRTVKRR